MWYIDILDFTLDFIHQPINYHMIYNIIKIVKYMGKRPLGRPRRRWEDNIKRDLQEVGGVCGDWMERA
jgi:hypothetical protein